jgi:hypothetical protein
MSWDSISNNQTVTFNNLLDALATGQLVGKTAFSPSQKCITKSEADTYLYIDTSYPSYASKASNQLVLKKDLVTYSQRIYAINKYNYWNTGWGLIIYSDNGGLDWADLIVDFGNPGAASVSVNNTGQYLLYGLADYVVVLSNYGANFAVVDNVGGDVFNITGTAMSNSGEYMLAIGWRQVTISGETNEVPAICKSSNYGVNWSLVYTYPNTQYQGDDNFGLNKIAISGSGQYILAIWNSWRNFSTTGGSAYIRSTNYGASFSRAEFEDVYLTDVAVSNTGQYQLMTKIHADFPYYIRGGLYWSNNYGAGFAFKIPEENLRALYCAMSASGQRMLVAYMDGTNLDNSRVNKFYFSTDFGVTWGSFNTNPTPPLRGSTPGGIYVAPDGNYALITYVDSPQITYTINFENWVTIPISQSYNFGELSGLR